MQINPRTGNTTAAELVSAVPVVTILEEVITLEVILDEVIAADEIALEVILEEVIPWLEVTAAEVTEAVESAFEVIGLLEVTAEEVIGRPEVIALVVRDPVVGVDAAVAETVILHPELDVQSNPK